MNKGNMIKEDEWYSMIRIDPSMKVVPAGYEHHGISEKN